jgi:hypothetical protein
MKLQAWIPNKYFDSQSKSNIDNFLDFDIIEDFLPEHAEFNNCPIKLGKILKWVIISNGSERFAVACNERLNGDLTFPIKRI